MLLGWVSSSSDNDEMGAHKHNQMLVSAYGGIVGGFRRLDPIPCSVGVPYQSPDVIQSCILHILFPFRLSPSAVNYDHSSPSALSTEGCRMVNSWAGNWFTIKYASSPDCGTLCYIYYPHVVLGFGPCVPTEHNEVRSRKHHHMPVACSWSLLFVCELYQFPERSELSMVYSEGFFMSRMKRSSFNNPCWPDAAPPYMATSVGEIAAAA